VHYIVETTAAAVLPAEETTQIQGRPIRHHVKWYHYSTVFVESYSFHRLFLSLSH